MNRISSSKRKGNSGRFEIGPIDAGYAREFGKKSGTYVGRVAIRATGSFNITTHIRTIQGISHRGCHILHKSDGSSYGLGTLIPSPKKGAPIPPLV